MNQDTHPKWESPAWKTHLWILTPLILSIAVFSVSINGAYSTPESASQQARDRNELTISLAVPEPTNTVITSDAGLSHAQVADSHGNLHICFASTAGNQLQYSVYRGGQWLSQTVVTGEGIGRCAIDIDRYNQPHIVFYHANQQNLQEKGLRYAYLNEDGWTVSTVILGTYRQMAIAIDSNNLPHIGFSRDYQVHGGFWFGDIRYAKYDGAKWNFQTVYTEGEEVYPLIKLVLDRQNRPVLLYKKRFFGGNYQVHLQKWTGTSWQLTVLEDGHNPSFPPGAGLVIDSEDELHWTYSWIDQIISSGPSLPLGNGYGDIAIDKEGRLYVAYEQNTGINLAIQSSCNDGWIQISAASIHSPRKSDLSLAVVDETIHLLHRDFNTNNLIHYRLPTTYVYGTIELTHQHPNELIVNGLSTATISSSATDCIGNPIPNLPISMAIDSALGVTFVEPSGEQKSDLQIFGKSDQNGQFNAVIRAGNSTGTLTIKSDDGALPIETSQIALIEPDSSTLKVLIDDYETPSGDIRSIYPYRCETSGSGSINNSVLSQSNGLMTMTLASDQTWGGMWNCLVDPSIARESIDFSQILPEPITSDFQSQITQIGLKIVSGTPGSLLRVELKDTAGGVRWSQQIMLTGETQLITADLTPHLSELTDVKEVIWFLEHSPVGAHVVVDELALYVTSEVTDVATIVFVNSLAMLLRNWNPETGLVRDKGRDPSGVFEAIQGTGSLAAIIAVAEQLDMVGIGDAEEIVSKIAETLLNDVPRAHGLLAQWVKVIDEEGTLAIADGSPYSSVDTIIAAIATHEALLALGLDASGTEQMIRRIDWDNLLQPTGIAHGYATDGTTKLPNAWDIFGGETLLVVSAYASVKGQVPHVEFPNPPTFNGSGFIDEVYWLFFPPPSTLDYWGNDWQEYGREAADAQINYFKENYPSSCIAKLELFGISAAETPKQPWYYRVFGVGGRIGPNDGVLSPIGEPSLGGSVVVSHYAGMIARLRPNEAIHMWQWLINEQLFTPLNNVESLMFANDTECESANAIFNGLEGSWNLALQALGWSNYLAEQSGSTSVLHQMAIKDEFLRKGYELVTTPLTDTSTPTPTLTNVPTVTVTPIPSSTPTPDLQNHKLFLPIVSR